MLCKSCHEEILNCVVGFGVQENWVPHAPRATVRQKEFLLEFMEARPFLAQKEYGTAEGRRKAINDWSTLANALNNIAGGAQKSVSQWQKVGTLQCLLSEYDRRVLTVMGGWMRVVGFLSVIDPAEVCVHCFVEYTRSHSMP